MSNLGNLNELIDSPTGQPWVALILRITGSKAGTIVLVIMMIILYFCCVNAVTTTSRQLWSFARDRGVPLHRLLSTVSSRSGVPRNAVIVTFISSIICALIIIGSTLAFNIILSISAAGLLSSYGIAIAVILRRRLVAEPMPASRFHLGKFGVPINILAICYCTIAFFFVCWPAGQ